MARTWQEITAEFRLRKQAMGKMHERMRSLSEIYDGDVVVPLPEMDRGEKAAVANLVQSGLDQLSMRIASTMPDVFYYPDVPGQRKSEAFARTRKMATLGWWYETGLKQKMRRRARWFVGYGMAPVVVRPNADREMPWWHLRDPLGTYPPPGLDPDCIEPPDCIFSFKRSLTWLRHTFPQTGALYLGEAPRAEDTFEMVEYVDKDVFVLGVIAPAQAERGGWEPGARGGGGGLSDMELLRIPNRIDMCPVVIPKRITLGQTMGQFDNAMGQYHWQARLMALDLIAIEKGIFPDTYLISRPNEIAAFVDGPYDGRSGRVNVVKGGDIREVAIPPNMAVGTSQDRLERAQRLTAGIPSEFGGESTSNIRTGRRGDAVLSAVVDFPVQEAQEMFSEALQLENRIAIAIDKTYFDKPKSFYVSMKGAHGRVDYTPSVHFTNDVNFVSYSHAGADINNLVVGIGQRVGMGLMSKRTGQELDPLIEDAEREHDRVVGESLEQSLLQGIQQQVSQGAIPPNDVARIIQLVRTDKADLAEAIMQVQEEAQKRQATPAPAGAPETQPGIAQPGQGAEQPTIPQAPGGLQNLTGLLSQLRRGQAAGAPTSVAGGGYAPSAG